ncbi:Ig domain protein, group 2 domain protein [Desulforamulus reducens MI-1]|uniref:Ig domain protein, group 2 domain protein n=1 Tax=Desulforamulus reducens (strain ATCC BAA-1160 / DSM 100696 / MI-1) TaxID=349161 RepID=A4J1G6_DESRM|nr:Ig-like domain-containing protein [Desulforamulus reducens]ABO48919.1 Ig domain protein, group 2 domain protein [Desulforamulus reducens MI-1]
MNLFSPNENDFNFILADAGRDILINGIATRALISNLKVKSDYDDKYISTLTELSQGDRIEYNGLYWLIVSEVNGKRYEKYKGVMRACNFDIKFNFAGNIKTFPAIVESKVFDIETGQYMTLPVGKILMTIQDNSDTKNIILNQRIIKMDSAWKVIGIDKTKNGLVILHLEKDSFGSSDDKENEIANRWQYEHIYKLTINEGESANILKDDTLQLSVKLTDNGVAVDSPSITYVSSDANICNIDNNGLITGIAEGKAIITAQMTGKPDVKDTISINVKVNHNYVLTITNESATLNIGDNLQLNYTLTDNGVIVDNPNVIFTSSDNNIATVNSSGLITGISIGTVTITAQMADRPEIYDILEVTVQEVPISHNYSISINGGATIKLNQTLSYTATFYDNGVEVADQSGTWSITSPNPDGTTNVYATIQSQTGNSVSIKATSTSSYVNKYLELVCTLNSDNTIKASKQIQVKSLF